MKSAKQNSFDSEGVNDTVDDVTIVAGIVSN